MTDPIQRTRTRVRRAARTAVNGLHRGLTAVGVVQSEERIAADAQQFWDDAGTRRWKGDSHWRDADVFAGGGLWTEIGTRHLQMFERGARALEFSRPWGRAVEWGCGGGANAVHFAPLVREFIGVDVAAESLDECARQVATVTATPFQAVHIKVAEPECATSVIDGPCDIFLCFYVFELIPSPEYGERLLRIARQLLRPGGLALIQVKYDIGSWRTRPRRRAYRSGLADMTTYPIPSFWELATRCGLTPEWVELVPRNELDERYAYFLLSRSAPGSAG